MISMSEGAFILEFAFPEELPISAHLSLEFHLVVSNKIISFFFRSELLPWLLDCCFFKVFVRGPNTRYFFPLDLPLWGIMIIISNLGWGVWVVVEWVFSCAFFAIIVRNLEEVTLGAVLQRLDLSKAFCKFCIFSLMALLSTYKSFLRGAFCKPSLSSISLNSLLVSCSLVEWLLSNDHRLVGN